MMYFDYYKMYRVNCDSGTWFVLLSFSVSFCLNVCCENFLLEMCTLPSVTVETSAKFCYSEFKNWIQSIAYFKIYKIFLNYSSFSDQEQDKTLT